MAAMAILLVSSMGTYIKGALIGCLIGAAVGVVISLIKKKK